MNEQSTAPDQPEQQPSDMLLVLDKEQKKIQAVKGIDKDGGLETIAPDKANDNQFLKVDKQGNLVSNFFANFFSQLKNPTQFAFFWASVAESGAIAHKLQQHIDQPSAEGNALLKKYEVRKEYLHQNNNKMEKTQTAPETSEYRFQPEQVNWNAMADIGLSKERLEKLNLLEPLLKGYKTNELVPLNLNLGVATTRMDARLSLQANDDGQVVLAIHGIRKEPQLHFPFFGHEFSKEDRQNLLTSGNMGRVVDLTNPRTGETIPSIISVDRLTNELIALRSDRIRIPDEIKGVKLDDQQKQTLMDGKPLYIEDMLSKKGEPFSAMVQFNADKRYVEFLFDRTNPNKQEQAHQQSNPQSQPKEAPRTFRGKELDEEQYNKYNAGQTIYVDGLEDKKGKQYQGYITFNQETGKTAFSFKNPNKLQEEAKPAESHKTQVAINSEGKTNEATKHIKEPLQQGQRAPKDKKQQQEQDAPKAPAKSKGRKI